MKKHIALLLAILCLTSCTNHPHTPDSPTQSTQSTQPSHSSPVVTNPTNATTLPSTTESTDAPPPVPDPVLTGWQEIDGKQYYYDENGNPHIGWLELEGERYYFHADGTMAQGRVVLSDTETHYFTSSGKEVILVNPWNYVPKDYTTELTKVNGYQVSTECAAALKEMLNACKKSGYSAAITSAYRTHEYQKGLFQRRVERCINEGYDKEAARIEAAKHVAVPGTSEHELGLAVDIVDVNYPELNENQENMPAQKWLIEHCWEYGFILRYPNGKTAVTGIVYEPWHYRYVGTELALELRDSGLCLEEYLNNLTN